MDYVQINVQEKVKTNPLIYVSREIHFPQFWCSARLQADADFTREKYDSGVKTNPNFTFPNFGAAQAGKIFLLRLF